MKTGDVNVPARYYLRLGELLTPQGVDFGALLGAAGLSAAALTPPDAVIPFSKVDRLLHQVDQSTGDTSLGFALGQQLSASSHTFVGFAMLNSATLDEALHFEARYFRLIMPSFSMRYHKDEHGVTIELAPLVDMSQLCLEFHLEVIAMAGLREISDLVEGEPPAAELIFSCPPPDHIHLYLELPGVTTRFQALDAPGLCIRLLDDPTQYALPIADNQSLRLAEQRCRELLERTTGERHFADWVATTLREVSEQLPSLEELAGLLNVSKRTLNRYLEREGTSYRQLSGTIQHELACKRLLDQGMSVSQVAWSLGYSEVSNFTRAFRNKAGCTPTAFVERYRAGND